jgi:hypothetical protein
LELWLRLLFGKHVAKLHHTHLVGHRPDATTVSAIAEVAESALVLGRLHLGRLLYLGRGLGRSVLLPIDLVGVHHAGRFRLVDVQRVHGSDGAIC